AYAVRRVYRPGTILVPATDRVSATAATINAACKTAGIQGRKDELVITRTAYKILEIHELNAGGIFSDNNPIILPISISPGLIKICDIPGICARCQTQRRIIITIPDNSLDITCMNCGFAVSITKSDVMRSTSSFYVNHIHAIAAINRSGYCAVTEEFKDIFTFSADQRGEIGKRNTVRKLPVGITDFPFVVVVLVAINTFDIPLCCCCARRLYCYSAAPFPLAADDFRIRDAFERTTNACNKVKLNVIFNNNRI